MDDQIPTINRTAIIVGLAEPFLQWVRAQEPDGSPLESLADDDRTTVFLVDETEEPDKALRQHWPCIFEEQLNSWYTDESAWPKTRNYKLFREWFDVRVVDLVFDLGRGPVEQE